MGAWLCRIKRNRFIYAVATFVVTALGLLSRQCPNLLPDALGKYPGDTLWAMMVFCGTGLLFPRLPTAFTGLAAFTFSCAVEFSQLYQAPWIESVRDTLPGRLILGRGFSWRDIAAYAIGILIGWVVEIGFYKFLTKKNSPR
jgi:hypothetical protein